MSTGARLDLIRGMNDAAVLAQARSRESVSRLDLADALDLTPQAVSKIVGRLMERGLLEEAGTISAGPGKPTVLYRMVPGSRRAIGVQVTRSRVRAVVIDLAGQVTGLHEVPLPEGADRSRLIAAIAAAARALEATGTGQLVGIGVGMPGPVSHDAGIYRGVDPADPWRGMALRTELAGALGLPVLVDNDSTAAVVGETWADPQAMVDVAMILVEDGIGAGLRLGGVLHRGARDDAGEIGHTVCVLDGEPCTCGRHGCAQAELLAAHDRGDVARAARILASVAVDLVQLLDVDRIVLGGRRVYAHHAAYMDALREALRTELRHEPWRHVEILLSPRGADAIAVGAAAEVLEHEFGVPAALSGPS